MQTTYESAGAQAPRRRPGQWRELLLAVAVASVASGPGDAAAQTARDFRGPPGVVPLTTAEPPAR